SPLSRRGTRQNKRVKQTEPYPTQKASELSSRELDQQIWAETFDNNRVGNPLPPPNLPKNQKQNVRSPQQTAQPQSPQQTSQHANDQQDASTNDMHVDQPNPPPAGLTSTDTNDTSPIPPVELSPIPVLPNLVIASIASAIKGNRPTNKKINVQRFFAIVEGFAYASTRKNEIGRAHV